MAVLGSLALVSATGTAVVAGPAGAGTPIASPATIEKVADGAPPGTMFTIELSCDTATIVPPGGGGLLSSLELTFTVDASGQAVPDGVATVGFEQKAECTVTETDAAGASTTSYACADNGPDFEPPLQLCATSGPQTEPISFAVLEPDQDVTVTVTNTFAPPPPPPVELQPAFTG